MLKKAIITSLATITSLTILSSPGTNNGPLNRTNLSRYEEAYIHRLFGTHREDSREVRDFINQIKSKANSCAEASCERYIWGIFPNGTFDKECVERAVRTAALKQVIEDGYSIAYEYTHDEYTLTFIKESLRLEILRLYQKCQPENDHFRINGSLKNYHGEKLRERIWNLKNEYDSQTEYMKQAVHNAYIIGYGFTHDEATLQFIQGTLQAEMIQLIRNPATPTNALRSYQGNKLNERVWDLKNEFDLRKRTR